MKIYSIKALCFSGLLCALFLTLVSAAIAQDPALQVTGTVRNDAGELLPNVSVIATNKKSKYKAGVQTDSSGVFKFSGLPPGNSYEFLVSCTGFKDQTLSGFDIKNGSTLTLAVKLVKQFAVLDDLVVIGYGVTQRRNVAGAVTVVKAREAGATTATNASQLLIGKAPGVQIVQNSGAPGADAQILIRGTSTFTDVNPLYVIDGIQGSKNLFNTLGTQDIEEITILKDAASIAIYGAAAANGVVIITTKKGKAGAPRISFNTQWGVSKAWKQLELLKAAQYVDALKDLAATKNSVLPAKFSTPGVLVDSTDWQKELFQTALVSEQNINISGAGEKMNYSMSATYIDQQSIIADATTKRLQARLYLEENLGRFRLTQSLGMRLINSRGANTSANVLNALSYAPYKRILDPSILGGYSILTTAEDFSNAANPIQEVALKDQKNTALVLFPQLSAELRLMPGLKFRSQFSAEINSNRATTYQTQYFASNNLIQARQATLEFQQNANYILENYLSFDKVFNKNRVSATTGMSYINEGFTSQLNARGTGQPNDNIEYITVAPSQAVTSSYYNYNTSGYSYFARLIYTYDNKYTLTGSYRRDGSSNFGSNNKYGNFAAVGLAWKFSDESFIKSALPFLSDGKLRGGWGQSGNNKIPNFLNTAKTYQGTPTGALVYSFGSTETFVSGTTITTLSNPDLKWEETSQTDIGMDLGFLENRLTMSAGWYYRKSTGLLVNTALPASIGVSTTGNQPRKVLNAGDVENKGFELMVGYADAINKDLRFNISVNGSVNKNKVLLLGEQFPAPLQDGSFGNVVPATTRTDKGSSIGSFYGYRLSHVARDAAEITALNQAAAAKTGNSSTKFQEDLLPGDFVFKDLNGDGVVNEKDQEYLGSPIPKFIYGINAGLTYKNFDLNLVLSGISDVKVLNGVKLTTQSMSTGHNASTEILNRWRQPGDVAALPRIGQSTTAKGNLRSSDWWIEDGSYLRMRNITLGYALSPHITSSLVQGAFKTVRIYIAAQNLFTITNYTGYDPEISGGSYLLSRGIDLGQIPQARTFMAGLQLVF